MTERSYFHNGTTRGDAKVAPYSASIFSEVLKTIYSSDGGHIIPGYLGSFNANGIVYTDTGAAFIDGMLYICTGGSGGAPIDANNYTDKYRIDRGVLRVNKTTHTVRQYRKLGIPSDYPEPPELLDDDNVYEIPLWQAYIAPDESGWYLDERKFANTAWHSTNYTTKNMIANGEFMHIAPTYGPSYWSIIGSATLGRTTQFEMVPRGYALQVTAPTAADGIRQVVRAGKPGNSTYTFKCVVQVDSGECYIEAGAVSTRVLPSREPKVILLRDTIAAAANINVTIRGNVATGTVFTVSGVSLTQGWIECPFEPQHETIIFNAATQIASGSGTDAALPLSDIYVPKGTKAILVMLQVSDTNSSAANLVYTSLQSYLGTNPLIRVNVGRLPNSYPGYGIGWIPIEYLQSTTTTTTDSTYELYAESTASGTLSWSARLLGIQV